MLSPSSIFTFGAIALVGYLLLSTFYQWYRLRKVPGPFLASFSHIWVARAILTGQQAFIYADLAKTYGHLVRTGPNDIITDDPDVLRRMSAARSSYGKDGFYGATIKYPGQDSMLSTIDVPTHDAIKAKMLGPYSGRETDAMEPIVDSMITLFMQYLRDKSSKSASSGTSGGILDLAQSVTFFTLDIITRVAFGEDLGFLRTDSDIHGFMEQMQSTVKLFAVPMEVPWIRNILTSDWFNKLFGPKPTDKKGLGLIIGVCEKAVNKRFQPDAPDVNDLLGAFVRQGIPRMLCLSEAMLALGAGSETSSSTIRTTMLYLMSSPQAYNKLKAVVFQAIREGIVSNPIKQEEAKKLPYLQAVIYEGLRMRPPAPIMFPKVVPPQGDMINGIFIPGGTAVGWNLLSTMRSPKYWGDDADLFRPERFLEVDEQTRISMERLVEMVFGYGKFGCAGKPLALMELNKTYFELFRHFDFQVVKPSKPWHSEFWTVWWEEEFFVRVTEAEAA